MSHPAPYSPAEVFSCEHGPRPCVPRVLIAPSRYIQGEGTLDHLGRYLSLLPARRPALLLSSGSLRREGARILEGLRSHGLEAEAVVFQGECSVAEVERAVATLHGAAANVDSVVAYGGGKCVDAGKAIARRLGLPVVVCPSLASNDAPCSALSVMYSDSGVFEGVEFFPDSPALVVVDTGVVARAPARYLVSGMGDAMATWYEARTCIENPSGRTTVGARPTLTAAALGELCANVLFARGVEAALAVQRREVDDALESIVEANTLLSGLGFESGGLAAAHAVAQGFTAIPSVEKNFLHGEMVAMGLLTQLVLEEKEEEATRVAEFFAAVGLPTHLGQLSLSPTDAAELTSAMDVATSVPYLVNEPFAVTSASLLAAVRRADDLGKTVCVARGDAAYLSLHA